MDRIQNRNLKALQNIFVNTGNSRDKTQRIVQGLLTWFSQNARDLPWRKTRDPYAIWISEIMLQQTQVITVIPFWERWMRELPAIQDLAKAAPDRFLKLWEGLGYYARARNLQSAAKLICEKHGARFPHEFSDVLALPGIGRYTAGAICSIAFNQPQPMVDGNVIRVLTRLFGMTGNPKEKTVNQQLWATAGQLVEQAGKLKTKSRDNCSHFNQSMMELGALICTPRQPRCPDCPLQKCCTARQENRVDSIPNLIKRTEATKRVFTAFVIEKNGRFLVQQRPSKVVNAGLWEFPNVEVAEGGASQEIHPFEIPSRAMPLCTIKHSITRYRITLAAFRATLRTRQTVQSGAWLAMAELQQLAFTSAHRKILNHLAKVEPA